MTATLLLLTIGYEQNLYGWLASLTQRLLVRYAASPVAELLLRWQRLAGPLHRQHGLPAGVLYASWYAGLSYCLLGLALPARRGWRWGGYLYGGVGTTAGLLLLAGEAGGWPLPVALANELLRFLVSPLPVLVLLPVGWGLSAGSSRPVAAGGPRAALNRRWAGGPVPARGHTPL